MPYIAIKAYPKDEKVKQRVVERINQVFIEEWGCPQEAITISVEEIQPDVWKEEVVDKEILPNSDKMLILGGEKKF